MTAESNRPQTIEAAREWLGAYAIKRLIVLSVFASGIAIYAGFQDLAYFYAIPLAVVLLLLAVRHLMLCLGLLIIFQQNDVIMAIVGLPELNKAIAISAILAVALKLTIGGLRDTLAHGFPVFAFMVGLVLLAWVSRQYAPDAERAIEQSMRLVNMSLFAGIFAFGVTGTRQIHWIVIAIIFSMLISAGVTLFDFARGEPLFTLSLEGEFREASWDGALRSSSTTLGSVPAAATMLLGGTVMAMVMAVRAPVSREFYSAAALIGSAAVVATLTRSAVISLAVVSLIMLWSLKKERIFVPLTYLTAGLIVVVALLAPPQVWSKFGAIGDSAEDWTLKRRVAYQVIGVDLLKENPILGVGIGNFRHYYASDDYKFVPGRSEEPRPLHNVYLQYATELGIVGFGLLTGLLISTFRLLLSATGSRDVHIRALSQAVLFCFVAMVFQIIFLSSIAVVHLWISMGLAVALAREASLERARDRAAIGRIRS